MTERRSRGGASGQGGTFGARLRRLREAAGITQEELASRAGLSPNAVSALERGARRRPYPHTVRSLADALGLDEGGRAALLAAVPGRGAAPSGAEDAPVPSASTGSAASTLPHPATALVGREKELGEVGGLLARPEVRLLTLTGIGGVGKTRLAAEVAREAAEDFPDGAAFVGLAPLGDPALLVSTVARVLGLREAEGRTPREVLEGHLRGKRLLLVLDNLEHLLGAAPEVAALIEACPRLVVLATSRAPLRVRGEQEYPVAPLALPPSTRAPTEDDVLGSPSGRLFLERARAVSPGFAVTPENAGDVAAVCWRLAGLPLALELAAAKVRLLEPAALLLRLDQALSTAWARDLPERQRTMRAALDWSHELLSEPEQGLFRRLSVFVGGFSLEAAEAVGATEGGGGVGEWLGHLGALVEQSLVGVEAGGNGKQARYGMLEPVRQYAREKLEESGEAEATTQGHAGYFVALAEAAEPKLRGADQVEWLDRLDREGDNLRAAFSWALGTGDAETAARLGWALHYFWWVRGYHREGRQWTEAALGHELPPALRARALHVAAAMTYAQGDYPAAEERWQEALRLSRLEGDLLVEGNVRAGMGMVEMVRLDHEVAASSMEEAIALFERCDEDYLASVLRVWLGTTLLARGEGERAERAFEEGLVAARRLKIPSLAYIALYNLAQLALARGDHAEAARMLGEGIELSGHTKDRASLAQFLEALAAITSSRGEAERSALLLGAAEGSLREGEARVHNFYRVYPSLRERAVTDARAALGDSAFEAARERGQAMTFEQAVGYALEAVYAHSDRTRG